MLFKKKKMQKPQISGTKLVTSTIETSTKDAKNNSFLLELSHQNKQKQKSKIGESFQFAKKYVPTVIELLGPVVSTMGVTATSSQRQRRASHHLRWKKRTSGKKFKNRLEKSWETILKKNEQQNEIDSN